MNVFYLSPDPEIAANLQCDKHVVKMILESAQMLATAHHELGGVAQYKPTHKNHPSAIWARSSIEQYDWLYRHFLALCKEYTKRYGRTHLSETKCTVELAQLPPGLTQTGFSPPPQCMPEQFHQQDTVRAYRDYYIWKLSEWRQDGKKVTRYKKDYLPENSLK